MFNNYEVGKTYSLDYVGTITTDDGSQYLVVTDGHNDFTIKPYDYQIEYGNVPSVLQCYAWKINLNGRPYFDQLKEQALKDMYSQAVGVTHKFVVDEIHMDPKTNCCYYILSDEYGFSHRYYPTEDETVKKSGDSIELIVKKILPSKVGMNNARLDLMLPTPGVAPVYSAPKPIYPKKTGRKNFGTENEKKEFKSSIVYPAGEHTANISKQLGIICRTIAGFMNAKGGTLYIGVSDDGYICGIENDYNHLNEEEEDKYTYKPNDDGFLQKITNAICKILGKTACTLISMEIKEEDGNKYCVVDIKKASRPIWFAGNKLFVRMITTNRKLSGDEITQFVLDRVSKDSFSKQKASEAPVQDDVSQDDSADTAASTPAQTATPVQPAAPVQAPAIVTTVPATGKAWRHLTLFSNGEWSFQKNALQGTDVVCNAIIPSDAKKYNHILILAYDDGHIEAISLKAVLYGRNGLLPESTRRRGGICPDNGNLISAFCANKKDILLLTSDVSGESFVKALQVDTLGIHDNMGGKGNLIVREKGGLLVKAVCLQEDHGTLVSLRGCGIFIEQNQKYTKGGVKLSSLASNYQQMLSDLEYGLVS